MSAYQTVTVGTEDLTRDFLAHIVSRHKFHSLSNQIYLFHLAACVTSMLNAVVEYVLIVLRLQFRTEDKVERRLAVDHLN